jgi:chloramphenicol-sensitive protein RarD
MTPAREHSNSPRRGALAAAGCYLAWGLFPLYWHQLATVNSAELIAHRHLWSLGFVAIVISLRRSWGDAAAAMRSPRALRVHALSGVLLTLNWLVFIWGVNHGHVVEASLGYFLVPLVNVGLGRFVLKEQLHRAQWLAICCAAVGVTLLVVRLGRLPWIALALAATFGAYGLLRKQSPLGPLLGLGLETVLLAPVALAFLLYQEHIGAGVFGHADTWTHVLLVSAGAVTAIPLLLFAYGARRVRFTTLGLLQYIAPTVQFALGTWVFRERFDPAQASAFALIWVGLLIYTADNLAQQTRIRD